MQWSKQKKNWHEQQNIHWYLLLHAGQQVHVQDEKTKLWEPEIVNTPLTIDGTHSNSGWLVGMDCCWVVNSDDIQGFHQVSSHKP